MERSPTRRAPRSRANLARLSDESLFVRVQQGDHEAYRVVVERYEERLRGFLYQRISDPDTVEDLCQETFLRVWRARLSFDPTKKFSTWIHTFASNLAKNEYRDRSRARVTTFTDEEARLHRDGDGHRRIEFPSPRPGPDTLAYGRELGAAIEAALDRMEEHHRVPFVLREFEGRTYQEIADATGLEVGTVKSRLNRARVSFRALLPVPL